MLDLNLNGPLFKRQRELLIKITNGSVGDLTEEEIILMNGLQNFLDSIADYAHDKLGIDCLLTEESEE